MGLKGSQTCSHLHSFITSALSEWICVTVTPANLTNAFNITRKEQKCGPGFDRNLDRTVYRCLISVSHQHDEARLWGVKAESNLKSLKEPQVTARTAVSLGKKTPHDTKATCESRLQLKNVWNSDFKKQQLRLQLLYKKSCVQSASRFSKTPHYTSHFPSALIRMELVIFHVLQSITLDFDWSSFAAQMSTFSFSQPVADHGTCLPTEHPRPVSLTALEGWQRQTSCLGLT